MGGFSHCAGMCGPFVLSQVANRLEQVGVEEMNELHRLKGALLVPYHLGRITTYTFLGVLAAGFASGMIEKPGFQWLGGGLLTLAAVLFFGYALKKMGLGPDVKSTAVKKGTRGRLVGLIAAPLLMNPVGFRGYILGIVLGFIPCGLLYAALAGAASTGDMIAGGVAMMAFAIGTVPVLLVAGIAGHAMGRQFQGIVARFAPFLLIINAGVLIYMAQRLIF